QSGNYKASFRISKRGNAHARRIAFIMAGSVKRNCPYFREYYLKKRNEGKSYTEAVIATSTKLLRTIYALLLENRCFK
ncbi:MAG: IS110 family transposase, partial [Candidatus Omnitrophota bacterium]